MCIVFITVLYCTVVYLVFYYFVIFIIDDTMTTKKVQVSVRVCGGAVCVCVCLSVECFMEREWTYVKDPEGERKGIRVALDHRGVIAPVCPAVSAFYVGDPAPIESKSCGGRSTVAGLSVGFCVPQCL